MQKPLQHIVIWCMILLLGVFTPGISIFKWVCGCTGKQNISLLANSDPCKLRNTSLLSNENSGCCKVNSTPKKAQTAFCVDPSCCAKQVQTLKLDEQSLSRFSLEIHCDVMQAYLLPIVLSFLFENIQELTPVRSFNLPFPPLLHLPSGKDICLSLHRLLN